MEKLNDMLERQIMPQGLFEHYVIARTDTFASGRKPVLGLNIPGFKGYRYPEKSKEDDRFIYEDNYLDFEERPGNFGGFEINNDLASGKQLTYYSYVGGLTEEGLKLGERVVYSKLTKFLKDNVSEVRFGKKIRFTIEDKGDTWVYEGIGEVKLGAGKIERQ